MVTACGRATQLAATPHNHNAISITAEGNPLWQRITLISNTTQSQSYQRRRDAAPGSESPGSAARTLFHSSSLLSSPHSSLPPLLHPALLFIFLSALLLLLRAPLSLTTPSCPVMDIGGVIS